ncbi:MAG TPA: hypothetical protein VHW69_09890 [Rhizomicrobium sp.]|nr:hypothetical protein [Rhizomicrobium sp.]
MSNPDSTPDILVGSIPKNRTCCVRVSLRHYKGAPLVDKGP